MQVTIQGFKGWLKSANNMKLSVDASVFHLTHEGITNFASMSSFDKKSIQDFPNICKNVIPSIDADTSNNIGAEAAVSGASMSSISVNRFITAVNAAKCYGSIVRVMNPNNVNYLTFLATFNVENEAFLSVKD